MKKSLEQRPHTSRPNRIRSWRPWTTRQTIRNCGERLRQLMASLYQQAENEAIVFNEKPTLPPKDIVNKFNKQFSTSKLGIHSSSHETRYVSREARKMSQETAPIFTTTMVTSATKSCSNSRAFEPDLLSIIHLMNLGPRATEYLTALFNDSFKFNRIPSIWKTALVIPIPKPDKDSSQGTS